MNTSDPAAVSAEGFKFHLRKIIFEQVPPGAYFQHVT